MPNKKKTLNERRREFLFELTPFAEMCINCVYYIQHYVHMRRNDYFALDTGHCRNGKMKNCKAYDCCDKFTNRYYDD